MKFPAAHPLSAAFLLVGGFTGWSAAFVLLYALLSFGCAYGWDQTDLGPMSLNRAVLIGAWGVSLAALAAVLLATHRLFHTDSNGAAMFLRSAGIGLSALALAATVWNFFMVTTLSTCL